jgi:transposase
VDIAKIQAENEALKRQNALLQEKSDRLAKKTNRLAQETNQLAKKYRGLEQKHQEAQVRIAELLHLLYSARSERFVQGSTPDPEQLTLDFGELEVQHTLPDPQSGESETITYQRKKAKHPGRQIIPDHLPTEEVRIEPSEDTSGAEPLGETIVDTLEYKPGSLIRRRYVFPRYLKKEIDQKGEEQTVFIQAKMPDSRPLPKSIAEPGLLAHLICSKFLYHLPFYRQIQQFDQQYGLKLAKSTVNDWFTGVCALLEPLYNRLKQKVLESDYLQADESPIKVQDKNKSGKTHRGYQWVYQAPLEGLVLFDYQKGRGKNGPKAILAQFRGHLQTDGYAVYDKLTKGHQDIHLLGCMAHARRYFFQAKENEPKAEVALNYFGQLYALERNLRERAADAQTTQAQRQEKALPVLQQLFDWARKEQTSALPKSPFGKALYYLLQREEKLKIYCSDGRLQIDNNLVENSIRPLALGRKNYLFAGSHKSAQRIAQIYSFMATCKKQNVNPQEWLPDVLGRIAQHPVNQLDELLPGKWTPKDET